MRGAVSVALVYAYYDPNGTTTDRPRSTLISMTLTVVLISTLAFGAITKPLLDLVLGSEGEAFRGSTSIGGMGDWKQQKKACWTSFGRFGEQLRPSDSLLDLFISTQKGVHKGRDRSMRRRDIYGHT